MNLFDARTILIASGVAFILAILFALYQTPLMSIYLTTFGWC